MEELENVEELIAKRAANKKMWLNSLKIFAISLFSLIFVFFFTISTMFVFAPKFDAKLFNFFGLTKAEETCYVRAYEKSKSNVDLYNLIIFESELENYEKELYYLDLLLNNEEYLGFYEKLDKSAVASVKDKELIAYACNTNGYLINQKVKCMYELDFSTLNISNYIKSSLVNDFLFDSSFTTYVELVYNDAMLTEVEKQEVLEIVYNSVDTVLTAKLSKLKTYVGETDYLAGKIIAQNTIVNIRKADYLIDKINISADEENSKTAYETELAVYNDLIK